MDDKKVKVEEAIVPIAWAAVYRSIQANLLNASTRVPRPVPAASPACDRMAILRANQRICFVHREAIEQMIRFASQMLNGGGNAEFWQAEKSRMIFLEEAVDRSIRNNRAAIALTREECYRANADRN